MSQTQATKMTSKSIVKGRILQTYSVVLSFLRDAAVAITPVEGHLLLLLFVQPDELLSRL